MPIMPMKSGLLSLVTANYRAASADQRLGLLMDMRYEADYRAGLAFTVDDGQDVVIRFTKSWKASGPRCVQAKEPLVERLAANEN